MTPAHSRTSRSDVRVREVLAYERLGKKRQSELMGFIEIYVIRALNYSVTDANGTVNSLETDTTVRRTLP